MHLETHIIFVSLRIMFTWINYGDLGKRKGEKFKNAWFWVLITNFSPQIWERGDLFSITKYLNSSIFLSTSINYAHDFMCFKFKSNFKYKQHPNRHTTSNLLILRHWYKLLYYLTNSLGIFKDITRFLLSLPFTPTSRKQLKHADADTIQMDACLCIPWMHFIWRASKP